MTRQRVIFIFTALALFAVILTGNMAANFAREGGNAYVMSPHSQVSIDGENSGAVVSVAGRGNAVTQPEPPQAESRLHYIGERVALAFWSTLLIMLVSGSIAVVTAYRKGKLFNVN